MSNALGLDISTSSGRKQKSLDSLGRLKYVGVMIPSRIQTTSK